MKKIKKHEVTLIFLLDEEVTPLLFAQKVARACSSGTLRPGEAVMTKGAKSAFVIGEKVPFAPWLGTPKELKTARSPKRRRA
jgi:hypothetical protein